MIMLRALTALRLPYTFRGVSRASDVAMSRYYKTLFQGELYGIKDYLLISILQRLRFPLSVSMSLKLEWEMGNKNANLFRLIVNNADNCFQDEYRYLNLFLFSSLRIFHILYFPHSPTSTFRTLIPPSQKRNAVAPPSPSPPPTAPPRSEKKTMQCFNCLAHKTRPSLIFQLTVILWLGVIWPYRSLSMGLLAALTADLT